MTTETAQRRLLEALATMRNTPGLDHGSADSPLSAAAIGFRALGQTLAMHGGPEERAVSKIHTAVADLCDAVNTEQKETSHG